MSIPLMNARERGALAAALVVACGCGLGMAWRERAIAAEQAQAALEAHADAVEQARRIVQLRSERELFAERPRPRAEIVEPFKVLMSTLGISPEALSQVSLPEPQPVASTPYQRQQASLTIQSVRVPDVVRLLARWSSDQPLWTLRTMRLEKLAIGREAVATGGATGGGSGSGTSRGGNDRYTATVTIENVHLAAAGPTSPGRPTGPNAQPPREASPSKKRAP